MLGNIAPYQVRILTAMSADAGAVTAASNPYCAGDGAVIRYCADERPVGSSKLAACGRTATAELPAGLVLELGAPRLLAPPPVHPAASASRLQLAAAANPLLVPPNPTPQGRNLPVSYRARGDAPDRRAGKGNAAARLHVLGRSLIIRMISLWPYLCCGRTPAGSWREREPRRARVCPPP